MIVVLRFMSILLSRETLVAPDRMKNQAARPNVNNRPTIRRRHGPCSIGRHTRIFLRLKSGALDWRSTGSTASEQPIARLREMLAKIGKTEVRQWYAFRVRDRSRIALAVGET